MKDLIEVNLKRAKEQTEELRPSREAALVRTKIEEALMWLEKVPE